MPIATLRARLAKAKERAAKNGYATVGRTFKPSTSWQDHASGRYRVTSAGVWQSLDTMPRHASANSRAYYCDAWPDGFRYVNSAYDISRSEHSRRVDHKGWYTDSFQDDTLSGHVLQITARNGKPCYIPGTAHSDQDGVTLYPLDMHDNALDCACAADQYAEHAAEVEREYSARDQAERQIAELREDITILRSDARALVREMKAARRDTTRYPAICATLCARLTDIREESRKCHKRIGKLTGNFWYAVES